MKESYYAAAYWGTRKESAGTCANRTASFLNCLSKVDSIFSNWHQQGSARKDASTHGITFNESVLEDLFLAGRNRTDFGNEVIDNLGFRIGLWANGEGDSNIGLGVKCGSYAPVPGVNSCILNLPTSDLYSDRLLDVSVLIAIITCLVEAWDPDWATINSRQHRTRIKPSETNAPHIGWISYLSLRRGVIPSLHIAEKSILLNERGTLIVTTSERFTAQDSNHTRLANEIAYELDKIGLMGPLQP